MNKTTIKRLLKGECIRCGLKPYYVFEYPLEKRIKNYKVYCKRCAKVMGL